MKRQEVGAIEQLEFMLEAEMAKEPVDIDTDYVDALAELILEYRNIPVHQSTPSAVKTSNLHRRKYIARVAALILILLGIVLIPTARVAEAFSWISIVKFFSPLMEQIGIHVNLETDDELNKVNKLEDPEPSVKPEILDEFVDQVIRDEKDLPEFVDGYLVQPPYLPDGYTFVRAELFANSSMTNLNMTYSAGEQELYINIQTYDGAMGTLAMMTEQNVGLPEQSRIVATSDEGINTVTMDLGPCQYIVWSFINEEELYSIIKSYEGEIFR